MVGFLPSSGSFLFVDGLSEFFLKALRISKECLHWVDLGLSNGLRGPSGRKGQVLKAEMSIHNRIFERIAMVSIKRG